MGCPEALEAINLLSNSMGLIAHWLTRRDLEILLEPTVGFSSHEACLLAIMVSLLGAEK